MRKAWSRLCILLAIMAALFLVGCNSSGSDDKDENGATSQSVPDFGGSIPKGDYVTAEITRDGNGKVNGLIIVNHTNSTFGEEELIFEKTLNTDDVGGFSFVRKTESDNEGNYFYVVFIENEILGMQKMENASGKAIGQPYFMFAKQSLEKTDLEDRVFSFLQFRAGGMNTAGDHVSIFEAGAIGFDVDGKLYGAAYDSEDTGVYSITSDGITTSQLQEFEDGSLVMWENGVDIWADANTFTGTKAGPIVIDFGPNNGGGAGFAIEQADIDTSSVNGADEWWNSVEGNYLLIEYDSDDDPAGIVNYYHIEVNGTVNTWNGTISVTALNGTSEGPLTIQALQQAAPDILKNITLDNEDTAEDEIGTDPFQGAGSQNVADAYQGKGVFKVDGEDTFIGFDPDGRYLAYGSDDGDQVTFGLAIKDENYVP